MVNWLLMELYIDSITYILQKRTIFAANLLSDDKGRCVVYTRFRAIPESHIVLWGMLPSTPMQDKDLYLDHCVNQGIPIPAGNHGCHKQPWGFHRHNIHHLRWDCHAKASAKVGQTASRRRLEIFQATNINQDSFSYIFSRHSE